MVVEQAARLRNEVATGVSRPGETKQGGDQWSPPCLQFRGLDELDHRTLLADLSRQQSSEGLDELDHRRVAS
jgi:hypothetical protein